MNQTVNRENPTPMERVLYEVKKIIVGQDHLLERLIVSSSSRLRPDQLINSEGAVHGSEHECREEIADGARAL